MPSISPTSKILVIIMSALILLVLVFGVIFFTSKEATKYEIMVLVGDRFEPSNDDDMDFLKKIFEDGEGDFTTNKYFPKENFSFITFSPYSKPIRDSKQQVELYPGSKKDRIRSFDKPAIKPFITSIDWSLIQSGLGTMETKDFCRFLDDYIDKIAFDAILFYSPSRTNDCKISINGTDYTCLTSIDTLLESKYKILDKFNNKNHVTKLLIVYKPICRVPKPIASAKISGKMTSAETKSALSGVEIKFQGSMSGDTTDANGHYLLELNVKRDTQVVLVAKARGLSSAQKRINIAPGQRIKDVDLEMKKKEGGGGSDKIVCPKKLTVDLNFNNSSGIISSNVTAIPNGSYSYQYVYQFSPNASFTRVWDFKRTIATFGYENDANELVEVTKKTGPFHCRVLVTCGDYTVTSSDYIGPVYDICVPSAPCRLSFLK